MRKVSASPGYLRNVFPILWLGANLYASTFVFGDPKLSNSGGYFLVALAVFGAVISRMLALRLMDEVYDEGDSLLVRRNSREQRIYLHQVRKVSAVNAWINLKTTCEGDIGKNVSFIPTARIFAIKEHPYFVELKERVKIAGNA